MSTETVKVLIVDDNENDSLLAQAHLARSVSPVFASDSASTYQSALSKMTSQAYDVCLIDMNLDERDGLELMHAALQLGCKASMIMVTGQCEGSIDTAAIEAGAADYLVKGKFDSEVLQRVIRHAMYRSHVESELRAARDNLEKRVEARTAELCDAIAALQLEINQRETMESQLRDAEERYHIIFEEAMDAIILISPSSGKFVDFNNQACRQLGYTREEFRNLSLPDIEILETPEQLAQHIDRILQKGAEIYESKHRTRTGQIRNTLISARPILLSGTKYLLAIFHDFTERKQIEDELRSAVIRLEQHNQAKSEFVANVSHELKTPLTSMMYGVRNLLKGIAGPLPVQATRYLKLFDSECQRLVGTINDILDLSKLDNHALTLSPLTAPLGHLLTRCIETLRPQTDANRITMTATLDPRISFVRCDPNMIQRVLHNILGNALKFTPPGGTVTLTTRLDQDEGKVARISITDNGIGIPRESLDQITHRYFRASNHASGSGLGLAISKDIMILHGGTLSVMSPPAGMENGTEVSITLPMAPPPTILVANASPVIRAELTLNLASKGYQVVTAESGQDTILMAEVNHPDLILLDLTMEDIHGTTVILTLRGSPTVRYTPIIAIAGAALDERTTDILNRFSIPTIPKPWDMGELMDTIESALLGVTAFQASTDEDPQYDRRQNPARG